MYARVTKWEGGTAEGLKAAAEETRERAPSGPPPGVPAKGFTMLIDPDTGASMSIVLFDTMEDLKQGDATLNDMTPGSDDVGTRGPVETYEVAVDLRL
jgi:hypothetical protein